MIDDGTISEINSIFVLWSSIILRGLRNMTHVNGDFPVNVIAVAFGTYEVLGTDRNLFINTTSHSRFVPYRR